MSQKVSHEELILIIFEDFDSFFTDKQYAKYKFNHKSDFKVYRTGSKSYLNIPEDFKYLDIDDDVSKLYVLFMVAHELAHLTNQHLHYNDKHKLDSQTIEMWADYFGAKIAMSILIFGSKFNKLLTINFMDRDKTLENIFKAIIEKLYPVFQNADNSGKYLMSYNRTSTIFAGIAAFLTRSDMWIKRKFSNKDHAEIGAAWGYTINLQLLKSNLVSQMNMGTGYSLEHEDIRELAENVYTIHNQLQNGNNGPLLKGLSWKYSYILDTYYEKFNPNPLLKQKVQEMVDKVGWNVQI